MKILHMADVHLGAEPDKGRPWGEGRSKLQWDAFAEAIEMADRENVDLVLIAGDLFHRQPLKRELKEVNYILSKLKKAKVVIMAGNHDYLSHNSFYRTFLWNDNVTFFQSGQPQAVSFPDMNVTVYGMSYEEREIKENPYTGIQKRRDGGFHILLAHGGDEKHIPLNLGQLKEMNFDYVALGHIHKPGQLVENQIVMAGALQPIDHNDVGPHGYWITELWREGANAVFYPIRGCEYVTVEVELDGNNTNRQIQEMVQAQLEQLETYQLAKIILTGIYDPEVYPDVDALMELDSVVDLEIQCKPDYNIAKLKTEYKNHIIGNFIDEIEALPQDEVTRRALYLGLDALMGNSYVY